MAAKHEHGVYVVPDITVKELLAAIPPHCHKRSALSLQHYADTLINPQTLSLPHPALYSFARFSVWALYSFWTGLFCDWPLAGHQAFSESKFINNAVGWVLHSALGVPYHSWRITHAKHHASTGHMTQDQVFVPTTRSQKGLKPFDPKREDLHGASVTEEVKKELYEALGDSPLGATLGFFSYLIAGWPLYLMFNSSGQARYPSGTNHFTPKAIMFAPHQWSQIIISDIGIFLWLAALAVSVSTWGFATVFRIYIVPYFCLLGDLGPVMGWIGAVATMGISETHILHHVCSKIPHYNAWEASAALRKALAPTGLRLDGAPGGWAEMYRVYKECKFVEDEGDVVFYKNAYGLAKMRPAFTDATASDSGIEIDSK
ncbi:oleoyl phosphatidylcholine desaturase [Mycena olivaceomarginata]|nr:oleoyl phosphatidylcholine desaturase [Mycena olivaceomarginata]